MFVRKLAIAAALLITSVAAADFVFFVLSPSRGLGVLLEGEVDTRNNAQLLTLRHKKYGEVILPRDKCKWFKAADPRKKQTAALKTASKNKDVEELWKLAKDSIRHGSAGNYFRAAEIVGEIDPDHKEAARARRLAALIDAEIPEADEEDKRIRKNSEIDRKMQFVRSPHFLLMHSLTAAKKGAGTKVARTDERIEVMEKVYKAYLAFFWSRGVELPPPKERLDVILLETEREYKDHSAKQDPGLLMSSGYFDRVKNVSFFFEHRGTSEFRELEGLAQEMIDVGKKRNVINRGDFVRLGKAVNLMNEIFSEQSDVTVCSHEMTHQLAHNTGLMPFNPHIPRWVAEGFACYFESPRDAQWSGIGAVNEERLNYYRKAKRANNAFCKIEEVVTDNVFDDAKTFGDQLNAYAISWALTHFLMERHFDRLVKYYQSLAKLPKTGKPKSPKELEGMFWACFTAEQKRNLDGFWHAYMSTLRTDLEDITNEAGLQLIGGDDD